MTDAIKDAAEVEEMRIQRFAFLARHADVAQGEGLEIGPLSRPIVPRQSVTGSGRIRYLDHLSTEGLREKYKPALNVVTAEIVPVDFVCPDGDIATATGGETFDYIVASHVVEHVPNLVAWFSTLEKTLKPGGVLFLVVPDKRFGFDYARPVSTPGQYMAASLYGTDRPTASQIYDHFALASDTHGGEVWTGQYNENALKYLGDPANALEITRAAVASGDYIDVHLGVFTATSFLTILRHFAAAGLLHLEVSGFQDVIPGQIEFYIALKKSLQTDLPEDQRRTRCLNSIPTLQADSFQAHQNAITRHMAESLHGVVSNYNAQDHRLNLLQAENAVLTDQIQHLHHKIGDTDDDTMHILRFSKIVHLAVRLSRLKQRLLGGKTN